LRIWSGSLPLREQLVANVTRGWGQTNASRLAPCRLVDLFHITDGETTEHFIRDEIASLIFLPDLRFLALTSFQSLNRPSLSSGSSSRISLLKQSFSVSRPRLRPPGNIHRWSRLLLTNNTRPRFVATSFDDFAITLLHCLNAESSVQILFHPVHKERHRRVQRTCRKSPFRVKSVVLCNSRLPVNFRYALLATEIARRRNMSRRAMSRSGAILFDHFVDAGHRRSQRPHRT
jgi:hypothetical protein